MLCVERYVGLVGWRWILGARDLEGSSIDSRLTETSGGYVDRSFGNIYPD